MEEVNLKPSRLAKRASYDSEQIYSILDEGLVCQVAYVENGKPMMIPTGYCRIEDKLYIHGSVGSHFMRSLADGRDVCISVSLLDGLVLARSAFHHSVNYRSVVIFGQAELITDEQEAWDALEAFTEHVIKGRWAEVREPDAFEMKKTMVLAFSLEKASAKVRVGNPSDDEEDYELPVWAGVLPLKQVAQAPITDPLMRHQTPVPDYVANYSREK